jgi:hypothetical protein
LGATPESLEGALAVATATDGREADEVIDRQGDLALPNEPDAERLSEIFDVPAFTTVYGIGDSQRIIEKEQFSSLF